MGKRSPLVSVDNTTEDYVVEVWGKAAIGQYKPRECHVSLFMMDGVAEELFPVLSRNWTPDC